MKLLVETKPMSTAEAGGALTLRHTFADEHCGVSHMATTDNLMDYPSASSGQAGTGLNRFQWEAIHNPALIGKLFQDDEDGAADIGKGKIFVFDDTFDNSKKKPFVFESVTYQVPYPFDKNIEESNNPDNACYIYIDYDLSAMSKLRDSFRKQYSYLKDPDLIEELIKQNEEYIQGTEAPDYLLNSPMTVKAINNDVLTVKDFYYSGIISHMDDHWRNNNWDFTGLLDNSKVNRQSFALASLQGGVLDMASFYSLDENTVYLVDYNQNDGNVNKQVLYNKEELRYWCYGYYLSKMQFTAYQAIGVTMQFFGKNKIQTFEQSTRLSDLPWCIDAMLDGYFAFGNRNSYVETFYINMYEPYTRDNASKYEFDIMWDLGELTLDMALFVVTGGTYSIGKSVIQVGSKFTMGAAIDISLQIALAKLDGTSTEKAYEQVIWSDVIYSGVETLHSNWVTQSTMACIRTAFNEMGLEYDYDKVLIGCGEIFIANFLARKLIGANDRFSSLIRKSLGKNASETINGLWVLGLDKATVEWIVSSTLGDIPEAIEIIIDNQFINGKKE